MSQAKYTPIDPGDSRDPAAANAIYTALGNASANLTAVNFAEEGQDSRAFEAHVVGRRTGLVQETTRPGANLALSGPFIQFVQNGTAFRLNAPGSVPAALAANEALRIRCRIWFESDIAAGLGIASKAVTPTIFGGQLVYNDGANHTIPRTFRRLERINNAVRGNDGVFFTEGWLFGVIGLINWIELQYTLSGVGTYECHPSKSAIWATLFRRQNQV